MLSQAVGYAISALSCIAGAGGKPMLVKEVADGTGVPGPYLAKIVQALARKGLVLTQRGVGGGVTLTRPATQISLFEVCAALNDPAIECRCMLGTAECTDERACPAHEFWTRQRDTLHGFLRSTSVADFAAFELRRRLKGDLGNSRPA
jgi:Rrf2 family protein